MPEQTIEETIHESLRGETQDNALKLVSFLKTKDMQFERGKGYWADQRYWMVKYRNDCMCYILIKDPDPKAETAPWTIWSDDNDASWTEICALDDEAKRIAWENIDICGRCGGCGHPGGYRKVIFGKEFDNVCRTTMRFVNPDAKTLEGLMKLLEIRIKILSA